MFRKPLQDFAQIAAKAVEQAQWAQALAYLAYGLEHDPTNPECRALLHRVLRATRDPLSLVPLVRGKETPYQIGAIRAYICAWRGQLDEAISTMAEIYRVAPGLPYVPWLIEWLSSERAATVAPDRMTFLIWSLIGRVSSGDQERAIVEHLFPVLVSYCQAHPHAAETTGALSLLAKHLGKIDEALALAQAAHKAQPGFNTAVILGRAYQARGYLTAALDAYREASGYNPDNPDIWLDIGILSCYLGQIEAGLSAYQKVLARQPEHPWALPASLHCRALLEPDGPWQEQLKQYARAHPDTEGVQKLYTSLHPYILYLPEPSDATTNLLRQALQQNADIREFHIGVSTLESPSARLAVELYQVERFGKARLTVHIAQIQQPDPREPRGPVEYVLWTYEGTEPHPAVRPPARHVARQVASLARQPYNATTWSQEARTMATRLGARHLDDLLGVMVHPPSRPAEFPVWVWIQRVQIAAAFILAHLDTGWENSIRRRALFSLALGPMDWTVEAAIVALAQLAREEPSITQDVATLYLDLFNFLPQSGHIPYLHALIQCSLKLPPLPDGLESQICLARGMARRINGDLTGALVDLSKAIRLDPRLSTAYAQRGFTYACRGDYDRAIADYDEAIRLNPQYIEVYNDRGIVRDKQGDYEGAIADYDEAIRLNPRFGVAYNNRGIARKRKGDYDGALADYNEAIRLDPCYVEAYVNRGNVRLLKEDYQGALADYNEALRLNPQYAAAYHGQGLAHQRMGEYESAIADFGQVIRLLPEYASPYEGRGDARRRKGDLDGAIADYSQAIYLTRGRSEALYVKRALVLDSKGDVAGALADYDEAIRLNPACAPAHHGRGTLLSRQGKHEAAIASYDAAIRADPQFSPAYIRRGIERKHLGDLTGAIADYSQALCICPDDAAAYKHRGDAHHSIGDLDGAIADYTEAIRLNPRDANAYNSRGNARADKGDYAGAIADYDEAIRLNPQDAALYENRGIARGTQGDSQGAMADFSMTVQLNPRKASAYMNLGVECYKQRDYEKALANLTAAINLDPRLARAYSNRAGVRCEMGDYDGAIADCDEALQIDPNYASAYNNRAWARLKKGEYDLAIADADIAIRLRPHGYFYNTRGQARGGKGDYAGAVADLQEALRLLPDHPDADDMRAKIAEWSNKL